MRFPSRFFALGAQKLRTACRWVFYTLRFRAFRKFAFAYQEYRAQESVSQEVTAEEYPFYKSSACVDVNVFRPVLAIPSNPVSAYSFFPVLFMWRWLSAFSIWILCVLFMLFFFRLLPWTFHFFCFKSAILESTFIPYSAWFPSTFRPCFRPRWNARKTFEVRKALMMRFHCFLDVCYC